ncbi:dihydroneopterin aldolase [Paracoccus sp. (in: a-proteobacteria)]|uniref:dihydroneopterin aldolase n=1 Tax=Paracoccus sp. TaxID=267 RepID=UPI0026DFC8E6|nr:dihydroneopterin aldolase [Paracoccus sp. (in: a-proteobacteria)]MDO5646704.1 dihydroneopterin aldolase [Paracoccus sp. (in: a-proteobacteria)]
MEQPDRIFLRDHVISAEIGAFQSERGRDQRLRFNLTVDLRDSVAGADDHVDRILSYDVLTQAVDTALADQRYNLVETLAEKIAAEVLAHPRAARIAVTVEKLDRGPGALGVSILRDAGRVQVTGVDAPVRVLVWGRDVAVPPGAVVIVPDAPALPLPSGGDQRRITLLALDQAAWSLAGQLGVDVSETRTELDAAIHSAHPTIWAPTRLCADAPEAGATPATVAFWLAQRLDAQHIDFATDTLPDAPPGLRATIGRV